MPIRQNNAADDEADLHATGPMSYVLKTFASRLLDTNREDAEELVDPPSDYTPPGRYRQRMRITTGGRAPRRSFAEQRRQRAADNDPIDQDDPEDPRSNRAQHEESYLELHDYDLPSVVQDPLSSITSSLPSIPSAPAQLSSGSSILNALGQLPSGSALSSGSAPSSGIPSIPNVPAQLPFGSSILNAPGKLPSGSALSSGTVSLPELEIYSTTYLDSSPLGVFSSVEDAHTFQRTEVAESSTIPEFILTALKSKLPASSAATSTSTSIVSPFSSTQGTLASRRQAKHLWTNLVGASDFDKTRLHTRDRVVYVENQKLYELVFKLSDLVKVIKT